MATQPRAASDSTNPFGFSRDLGAKAATTDRPRRTPDSRKAAEPADMGVAIGTSVSASRVGSTADEWDPTGLEWQASRGPVRHRSHRLPAM